LEDPAKVSQESVIASNHYTQFQPPAVIPENMPLKEANWEQLARTEKLK